MIVRINNVVYYNIINIYMLVGVNSKIWSSITYYQALTCICWTRIVVLHQVHVNMCTWSCTCVGSIDNNLWVHVSSVCKCLYAKLHNICLGLRTCSLLENTFMICWCLLSLGLNKSCTRPCGLHHKPRSGPSIIMGN